MKLSFSTLACPDWTLSQIIAIASAAGYDGIELRFVENEDSLWKLPSFSGKQLASTKHALSDHGLVISCLDTSCRFHSPHAQERAQWLTEGERMAELAASLGAPSIRVFGDTIQPGADRSSTRRWIADSIRELSDRIAPSGIEVWLETHGDFAGGSETAEILAEAKLSGLGVVWDPANCFLESGERPRGERISPGREHSPRASQRPVSKPRQLEACSYRRRKFPVGRGSNRAATTSVRPLRILRMGEEMASGNRRRQRCAASLYTLVSGEF